MSTTSVLFIIIPLLIFVVVDSFASLNVALITTIIAAVAECVFSYIYFGELDSFSVFSIFLVILMAGLASFKKSRRIFYFKPAILSYGLGLFLLITYFMGQYVLYDGMMKYGHLLAGDQASMIDNERLQLMLKNCSLTVGVASMIHGLVATYAALKLNKWWWFMVAGVGSYVALFIGTVAAFYV